jgi:Fur family transcriptional regulator, ferric uptake regulator
MQAFPSHLPEPARAMSDAQNLKTMGLKATLPRLRVLQLFETQADRRHLSAEEVYRLLSADGIDIGLATVYRVLTQFEQAGLLIRHHFESGKAVFELNQGEHHDHLVCMDCNHVEEFFDPEIERLQEQVAAKHGYRIREHSLHLYAECIKTDCPRRR